MKTTGTVLSLLALSVLIACEAPAPKLVGPTQEVCTGVNAMVANEINAKYDISSGRMLALKLAAAAEADVARLKGLKAAKLDTNIEAKLGSEIKGVVETKTSVTTDYYQQDRSFAQAACIVDGYLAKKELSATDRSFFEEKRRALVANRVAYLDVLTGLKKN